MADNSIDSTKRYEVVTDKGGRQYRRTVAHLPSYYRTDANQKFLSSTLDQVVQKGKLERLDGYIGRLDAYTRNISDKYLTATSSKRQQYQLEPTITIKDKDTSSINPQDKIKFTATRAATYKKDTKDRNTGSSAYKKITKSLEQIKFDEKLTYILPDHLIGIIWKGRFKGQTQKWFVMRLSLIHI